MGLDRHHQGDGKDEEQLNDTTADIACQAKKSQKASSHAGGNGRPAWAVCQAFGKEQLAPIAGTPTAVHH